MNIVILHGNLGQDPELRHTPNGNAVCDLRVATQESRKDAQGNWENYPEWHTVTVWGKQAENCARYLSKGSKVVVNGSLTTESYEKDGVTRHFTKVKAHRVEFGAKPAESQPTSDNGYSGGYSGGNQDDEIPF